MSNVNLLDSVKSSTAVKSTKQSYSLNEILFVMKKLSDGVSLDDISNITGRSKHTLRYKFLEGEVTLNGKTVVRSVKKYKTMEELFADHGEVFKGDEDINNRIEQYSATLTKQAV